MDVVVLSRGSVSVRRVRFVFVARKRFCRSRSTGSLNLSFNFRALGGGNGWFMTTQIASVSEIFSSLQGEGTRMGERHLFVRFEKCNIHCDYCDELEKPGSDFDLESVLESILSLERQKGPHSYVSLTGGEPLVYRSFLKSLLPQLKQKGFKTYLETNGILWQALRDVLEWVDVVAMDVKPSSVTKEASYMESHRAFLKIALPKEVFIKMVCSKEIDLGEFKDLCLMIGQVCRDVPLLLQPVSTTVEGFQDAELMTLLGELQSIGLGILSDVRIVPRLHKILNIR